MRFILFVVSSHLFRFICLIWFGLVWFNVVCALCPVCDDCRLVYFFVSSCDVVIVVCVCVIFCLVFVCFLVNLSITRSFVHSLILYTFDALRLALFNLSFCCVRCAVWRCALSNFSSFHLISS